MRATLQYRLEGEDIVIFKDGREVRIPAGQSAQERLRHVMLSELTPEEQAAVRPVLEVLGGAGMTVWENEDED